MELVLLVNDSFDCGSSYYTPFSPFGECCKNVKILDSKYAKDVVLVVFTGGEDVDPSMYNEERNLRTMSHLKRDLFESEVFKKAVSLEKNIVGICRGSQFICVMNEGKLVQHVTNHTHSHIIKTDDGRKIAVSSTHHQMQLPPEWAVPVAWAEPKLSTCYQGPTGVEYKPEYEYDVVWYPKTNSLGMQYHPEFMSPTSEGFLYSQELVERFFHLKRVN